MPRVMPTPKERRWFLIVQGGLIVALLVAVACSAFAEGTFPAGGSGSSVTTTDKASAITQTATWSCPAGGTPVLLSQYGPVMCADHLTKAVLK